MFIALFTIVFLFSLMLLVSLSNRNVIALNDNPKKKQFHQFHLGYGHSAVQRAVLPPIRGQPDTNGVINNFIK